MTHTRLSLNRRQFVLGSLGGLARGGFPADQKKVAAIVTEYRYRSHADVICGRMLEGYTPDNVRVLTTGALAFLLESRYRRRRLETPELAVSYRAPRDAYFQRA